MKATDVPLIRAILDSGPADRVYDSLLLAGPVVLAVIAIAGRSTLTTGVALLYIGLFVGHLARRAGS